MGRGFKVVFDSTNGCLGLSRSCRRGHPPVPPLGSTVDEVADVTTPKSPESVTGVKGDR